MFQPPHFSIVSQFQNSMETFNWQYNDSLCHKQIENSHNFNVAILQIKKKLDGHYDFVDYYASVNIYDLTMTLTHDLLTPKFDAFILAPKSISDETLVKFCQQIPKISW